MGVGQELFGWFAARDHFPECKQDMATIEARDRDNVHKREDDGEESGDIPERVPVPIAREETAEGAETAEALDAILGKEYFERRDVGSERLPAISDAARECLEERIVDMLHDEKAGGVRHELDAQLAIGRKAKREGAKMAVAVEADKYSVVGGGGESGADLGERRRWDTIDRDDTIASEEARLSSGRAGYEIADNKRDAEGDKLFGLLSANIIEEVGRESYIHQ